MNPHKNISQENMINPYSTIGRLGFTKKSTKLDATMVLPGGSTSQIYPSYGFKKKSHSKIYAYRNQVSCCLINIIFLFIQLFIYTYSIYVFQNI